MKVSSIIIRVADLDTALEFWSNRVGLEVMGRMPGFGLLDGGGLQLVLNQVESPPAASLTEVVLESDDVAETFAGMAARGVPFEVELRPVTGDGERNLLAAHFRDPDGNLASLTGWVPAG